MHEAEQHALQALAIRERLNSPETAQTLEILERIAEARGDAAAAAEYRHRAEAAAAEAQQRAGRQGLPLETIVALLQLALTARGSSWISPTPYVPPAPTTPPPCWPPSSKPTPGSPPTCPPSPPATPAPPPSPRAIPGPLVPSLVRRHPLKPEAPASGEPSRPFHWRIGFPSRSPFTVSLGDQPRRKTFR